MAWNVIPAIAADAYPGGVVARACYETLRDLLLETLRRTRPDGVLLSLHGAMVADDYMDPEGDVLARVREVVGPRIPVVAVLDLHGHVSPTIVQAADVVIGYTEYPHTDAVARGLEAARLLAALKAGGLRPVTSLVRLPALLTEHEYADQSRSDGGGFHAGKGTGA